MTKELTNQVALVTGGGSGLEEQLQKNMRRMGLKLSS